MVANHCSGSGLSANAFTPAILGILGGVAVGAYVLGFISHLLIARFSTNRTRRTELDAQRISSFHESGGLPGLGYHRGSFQHSVGHQSAKGTDTDSVRTLPIKVSVHTDIHRDSGMGRREANKGISSPYFSQFQERFDDALETSGKKDRLNQAAASTSSSTRSPAVSSRHTRDDANSIPLEELKTSPLKPDDTPATAGNGRRSPKRPLQITLPEQPQGATSRSPIQFHYPTRARSLTVVSDEDTHESTGSDLSTYGLPSPPFTAKDDKQRVCPPVIVEADASNDQKQDYFNSRSLADPTDLLDNRLSAARSSLTVESVMSLYESFPSPPLVDEMYPQSILQVGSFSSTYSSGPLRRPSEDTFGRITPRSSMLPAPLQQSKAMASVSALPTPPPSAAGFPQMNPSRVSARGSQGPQKLPPLRKSSSAKGSLSSSSTVSPVSPVISRSFSSTTLRQSTISTQSNSRARNGSVWGLSALVASPTDERLSFACQGDQSPLSTAPPYRRAGP